MSAHDDDDMPPNAELYVIWSHEHRRWWGVNARGYVQSFMAAGRYTHREALLICARAIPGNAQAMGALPELPVRLADVLMMQLLYRADHASEKEPWE
jgi:hypothetical protein